jgi:hypothetical protein
MRVGWGTMIHDNHLYRKEIQLINLPYLDLRYGRVVKSLTLQLRRAVGPPALTASTFTIAQYC